MDNIEDILAAMATMLVALSLIQIISLWRIFLKAGRPGWASIVPIYNIIVLLEVVKKPVWWIFLLLIPVVNVVISIWITNMLSLSFGKESGFTVGLIFLGFIFYPILGFGTPVYVHEGANPEYEDLSDKTRSWLVLVVLISYFIFPLVYAFFRPDGLLKATGYETYSAITAVFNVLLGISPFLLGISVKQGYRHAGITLSVCFIILRNLSFSILPTLGNLIY
jgi:uncharacterized membrane protein (DUF485 family)